MPLRGWVGDGLLEAGFFFSTCVEDLIRTLGGRGLGKLDRVDDSRGEVFLRGQKDTHHLEQRVDDGANGPVLGAETVLTCLRGFFQKRFCLQERGVLVLELGKNGVSV